MARSEAARRGRTAENSADLTDDYELLPHDAVVIGVSRTLEQQRPISIYAAAMPDVVAMQNLRAKFASLAQDYPLTRQSAWQMAVAELGPLEFFAIESLPVTYDVDSDRHVFTGRANVLAEIVSKTDPELNESITIGASVTGVFGQPGKDPKITEFKLDPISA